MNLTFNRIEKKKFKTHFCDQKPSFPPLGVRIKKRMHKYNQPRFFALISLQTRSSLVRRSKGASSIDPINFCRARKTLAVVRRVAFSYTTPSAWCVSSHLHCCNTVFSGAEERGGPAETAKHLSWLPSHNHPKYICICLQKTRRIKKNLKRFVSQQNGG